ncbi:molybdopterin dinucleotide binding domain-containing protein [Shigella flexneri]
MRHWRRWLMNLATTNQYRDAKRLGIEDEALVWVHSRKGKIITRAQVSDCPNKGAIYITYQWWIGAGNQLVTENLSPITKTPE